MIYEHLVSQKFTKDVARYSELLDIEPDWLMAVMHFETGGTFSPSIMNAKGSGAVGLIQFMPQTAASLGTSTHDLSRMTAEEQLPYVYKHLKAYAHRLDSLGDVYMAVLWPIGIGKAPHEVIFDRKDPLRPKNYAQNKGFDYNKDGKIIKAEIVKKVQAIYDAGKGIDHPSVTIRFHSTGEQVLALQELFHTWGYEIERDGIAGKETDRIFLAVFGVSLPR